MVSVINCEFFYYKVFFEWFQKPEVHQERFCRFFLLKFCTGVNKGKERVNHIFRPSGSTVTLPAGGISMPMAFPDTEI